MNFFTFNFLFFRVIFALLVPDPADQDQCGSGSTTLLYCKREFFRDTTRLLSEVSCDDGRKTKRTHPSQKVTNFLVLWIRILGFLLHLDEVLGFQLNNSCF
jgi:hypothetical protein